MNKKQTSEEFFNLKLGHTLRSIRKAASVNQNEVAELLNVHQAAVSRIERGSQSFIPEYQGRFNRERWG